jgi:hypothetical protein
MIMETGFCSGPSNQSELDQARNVKEVFRFLNPHIRNVPWFSGLTWYEYHSNHSKLPCESYFGLHYGDGVTEKPAWKEFTRQVNEYKKYGKILGITYHY